MTTDTLPPIYRSLIEEFDYAPEIIAAKCKALVTFTWNAPKPIATSTPRPGARARRKKARR